MKAKKNSKVVYVIGAGLSAGLGFPTVANLLEKMWGRIEANAFPQELSEVIKFHHPFFNPNNSESFPNVEQLLSEMMANEMLFEATRPQVGNFTKGDLLDIRQNLLLELVDWFHELQKKAVKNLPGWMSDLKEKIQNQNATIISFNWDLVLDELLYENNLNASCYMSPKAGTRLIKPHGSLNWYEEKTGRYLKDNKKFLLSEEGEERIFCFNKFRAPKSSRREYMPLIVPPVYAKEFSSGISQKLWLDTVKALSTASEVNFLGYSMPTADFHAKFIFSCGFYNQIHGALSSTGKRRKATGPAKVNIVDPDNAACKRITDVVGLRCKFHQGTVQDWVEQG